MKAKSLRYLVPVLMLLVLIGWPTSCLVFDSADKAVLQRGDDILLGLLTERSEATRTLNLIATGLLEGKLTKAEYDRLRAPYVSAILKTEKWQDLCEDLMIMPDYKRADKYREIFGWGLFPP